MNGGAGAASRVTPCYQRACNFLAQAPQQVGWSDAYLARDLWPSNPRCSPSGLVPTRCRQFLCSRQTRSNSVTSGLSRRHDLALRSRIAHWQLPPKLAAKKDQLNLSALKGEDSQAT